MKNVNVFVKCHDRSCLNNIALRCTANMIVIGGTGKCKCYIDAKQAMKHCENTSKKGIGNG